MLAFVAPAGGPPEAGAPRAPSLMHKRMGSYVQAGLSEHPTRVLHSLAMPMSLWVWTSACIVA